MTLLFRSSLQREGQGHHEDQDALEAVHSVFIGHAWNLMTVQITHIFILARLI